MAISLRTIQFIEAYEKLEVILFTYLIIGTIKLEKNG